jgi:TonB family protein
MSELASSFSTTQSGRRRFSRYEVTIPFEVAVFRPGTVALLSGRSQDLGVGGLSGVVSGALHQGENVEVTFSLPIVPDPLSFRGIVRHQENLRCGFEFLDPDSGQIRILQSLGKSRLIQARLLNDNEKRLEVPLPPPRIEPTVVCRRCAHEYPEEVPFCVMCGTPQDQVPPAVELPPPRPERPIKFFNPTQWVAAIRKSVTFYTARRSRKDAIIDAVIAIVFLISLGLGVWQWLHAPAPPESRPVRIRFETPVVRRERAPALRSEVSSRISAGAGAATDLIREKGKAAIDSLVDPLISGPMGSNSSGPVGQPGSAASPNKSMRSNAAFLPNYSTGNSGPLQSSGMSSSIAAGRSDSPESALDVQQSVVQKIMPVYPIQARNEGVEGEVVLQALIGKDGSVSDVRAVTGPEVLTGAAIDAVRRWRFKPYQVNGEPVEIETNIRVDFTLPR